MTTAALVIILVIIITSVGTTLFCLAKMFTLAQEGKTVEMLAPFASLFIGNSGLYWLFSIIIQELHKL